MKAHAHIETPKSSRYLQALCGHFSRKTKADYDAKQGKVTFDFGHCDMEAESDALVLFAEADTEANLERLKKVIGSHLERFAVKDDLKVQWNPDDPSHSSSKTREAVS